MGSDPEQLQPLLILLLEASSFSTELSTTLLSSDLI